VNGDTVTSVTLTSDGAPATATVSGSPYAITPSAALGTGLGNYTIHYVDGTLTLNKAVLTITAKDASKTYGATVTFAGTEFTFTGGTLFNSDAVSSVTLTSLGAAATAAAGSYPITPSGAVGTGLSNYTITYANGTLTVNKAVLTITASSGMMTFGGTVPIVVPIYSGFVAGDSAASLTTNPICSTAATSTSPVSVTPYATACSGAVASNYVITYVSGGITVAQATTTIAISSSLNPSNWGQVVNMIATVTPQISGTPSGTVLLYNAASGAICDSLGNSTLLDTLTLSNGTASTAQSALPVGTDTILACYGGDANFLPSSGTVSQTVIPAPIVNVSPASVSFGNQQAGTTSGAMTVTVSNTNGTAPLIISNVNITGTNASYFTQTNNCSSVPVNGNCTINVKFSPTDTGVATAILTITDNNENATGSQQFVALTGAGTSSISSVGSLSTYAIFATANGCSSINGSGGITVDSFNSSLGYSSSHQNSGANVGTDGNITLSGSNTVIYGTASSPFGGSGNCSTKSMTGYSTSGAAKATGGQVALSQPVTYPAPPPVNPAPPTSNQNISGSCGSIAGCTNNGTKDVVLTPGTYGNLSVSGGTTTHVRAGTYNVNSLSLSGNSTLVVDSVPVIINLGGNSLNTGSSVLDFSGGTMSNSSGIPSNLQFYYAGTRAIKLSGGSGSYAVIYAPNSPINLSGGSHFYGALLGSTVNDSGGTAIHYDTSLPSISAGNYIWFNSTGLNVRGLPSSGSVKLYVTNATIKFNANGTQYSLPVPNAVITFSATAASASTTWDATNNRWSTLVPTSMVNGNTTIHTFLDDLVFPVQGNFPGGVQNVTWSAAFSTDTPGISFQWQWGAAIYNSSFTNSYASLGVNPVDNSDPAGTPENYKSDVIFGGTGAGPTGLYVGTAGVIPTIAPASMSPSSLDFATLTIGSTSNSMTAALTNNQSGPMIISSVQITGTNPGDFAQTNACPIAPNTLAGGGTCSFTVTFKPTAAGKRTAKIVVNDDANNSPQTVFLKGTGQ
jgi:MBG domain-containing protein/Big-like domain-containing protein/centrosomal CEP192-like protein/HYDIN/CFA65/VesB family protein